MPELPEVETVRRGLEPVLAGQRIVRLEQRRADLRFPFPPRFAQRLSGKRVERVRRRAKYLLADIEGDQILAMHLGMTGRFTILAPTDARQASPGAFEYDAGANPAHDHVILHMESGVTVTYNDARRFGYMDLFPAADIAAHPHFHKLGVEPLGNDLNAGYLAARAQARRTDLKAFLMDQRIVAGLGNIYVCEALYRARLSPNRSAGSIARKSGAPTDRAENLTVAIRNVLEDALRAGGSTLRDFRQADGALGYFQHTFAVYGREGEPCARTGCRGTVRRTIHAGRSTFHCPICQR